MYIYMYIYTYICRTNHTLPSYKHVAYLRVPVPWTFIIPAVASKKGAASVGLPYGISYLRPGVDDES